MYGEDFSSSKDDNGVEYITYEETPTKTRQGGLRKKEELFSQKRRSCHKEVRGDETEQWAILPRSH